MRDGFVGLSSSSPLPGRAVDRGRSQRWSARSAARTNDLDVDEVDRIVIGRGVEDNKSGCQVMCCPSMVAVGGWGVPAPRLI